MKDINTDFKLLNIETHIDSKVIGNRISSDFIIKKIILFFIVLFTIFYLIDDEKK